MLDISTILIYVFLFLTISLVFGTASKKASLERGYTGGFWWGFLFWGIGLLVVALKPSYYIVYNNKLKALNQLYEDGYINEKEYKTQKDSLYYNFPD